MSLSQIILQNFEWIMQDMVAVPTLSEWALILFALALFSLGVHQRRRR